MITKTRILLVLGALAMGTAGVAQAAIPPNAGCSNAKMKCAVNYVKGQLGCEAKAAKLGAAVDSLCTAKVNAKFDGAATACIGKADTKFGGTCPQAGDGGLKAEADSLIASLKSQLYVLPSATGANACWAGQAKCVTNLVKGLVGVDSKALKGGLFTDPLGLDKNICKFDDSAANAQAPVTKCLGLAKGCMNKLDAAGKACTLTGLTGQASSVLAQVTAFINRATCEQSPAGATFSQTTTAGGGPCGATDGTLNPTLTCGDLYIGSGTGTTPPGATPAGSLNAFNLAGGKNRICPRTQAQQGNGNKNCSAPGCFFGSPLPIMNGGLSTCVDNIFSANGFGSLNPGSGAIANDILLLSVVTVTGNAAQPCPHCVGGTCDATAANFGAACVADATSGEAHDCVPAGTTLPPFAVNLLGTTTGTSSKGAGTGIFCPAEGQTDPGAFGDAAVTAISETGSPNAALSGGGAVAAKLASVFCIPPTGNVLIDGAAGLPGPGAVSLVVNAQIN